ncbi:MAG: hypothetical protein ABJF11_01900 [Reichenbachiella sp.]|uniref:hypothetical protein n=1 Tax=Reichenbachiella sp. TaxID=2184521 RepID=UPI003266AEA2
MNSPLTCAKGSNDGDSILEKKPKNEDKISNLLIIVLVKTKANRVTLESELAFALENYGITTVQSHKTRLIGYTELSKKEVIAVCQKNKTDGVLVVRLLDSEAENSYSYNQRAQYTGSGFSSANSSGVMIKGGKTYSWGDYAFGNYFDSISSSRVEVQSDIYHVNGAKQLMTDDIIMRVDPRDEEVAIGKFAKKLSKKISKQKFMVRN